MYLSQKAEKINNKRGTSMFPFFAFWRNLVNFIYELGINSAKKIDI